MVIRKLHVLRAVLKRWTHMGLQSLKAMRVIKYIVYFAQKVISVSIIFPSYFHLARFLISMQTFLKPFKVRYRPYITSAYFWTFSDPPTMPAYMYRVLNVHKQCQFKNPPNQFFFNDVIYRI